MFRKWWVPKKDIIEKLTEKIYPRSITYKSSECLELPPLNKINKYIDLTSQQIDEINKLHSSDLPEGQYRMKIRCICSGFYYTENGVELLSNNKISLLESLIEDIVINEENKLIIWVNFDYEVTMIKELIDNVFKIRYAVCSGQITNQDKQDIEIGRFKNSNNCNILIASFAKGSESLNLQCAKYAINFSLPDDFGFYSQAAKRNHRGGVKHASLTTYNFITKDSIEEDIFNNLKAKESDHNYIFNYSTKRYKYIK